MLAARSWEMPLATSIRMPILKMGGPAIPPDKLLNADYFTANDTGKYERALGMTQEKIKI